MKFLLLACFVAAAAAHDFSVCAGKTDAMGVTSVDVFPDPAQVGKSIEVTINGKATAPIAAGAMAHLKVELFKVEIAHLDIDMCKSLGLTCPIAAGTAYSGKLTYPVPSQAPGGITVTIEIDFNHADKSDLGCITLQEKLVKPSALLAAVPDHNQFLFTHWAKQYQKNYDVEEVFERLNIFESNFAKVVAHNEANKGWTMSLNQYADLTADEFAAHYKGFIPRNNAHLRSKNTPDFPKGLKTADSIDWVEKGAVTAVKNQGQCGSCWAFSTTGSIEGAHQIATGDLVSLSEQELVDCAGSAGNQGCNGGLMDDGFEWVIKNGVCSESDYPYSAKKGTCQMKNCNSAASITGYKDVPQGDEDALLSAANIGPVSVAIEADQSSFQFYSGGVMSGLCGKKLDHGVLLVGYGTENGQDYWKVKNSWGASWGEEGYIRMIRGQDQCGIADSASYPTGASVQDVVAF